jgi:hypothetical protein
VIPRCPHGVYSPDGSGQPSDYCSGCKVPTIPIVLIVETDDEAEDVLGLPECPLCFAPLQVFDEYDLECTKCGWNDL